MFRLRRRRDDDRYALTPLAEEMLRDPLETWYALENANEQTELRSVA